MKSERGRSPALVGQDEPPITRTMRKGVLPVAKYIFMAMLVSCCNYKVQAKAPALSSTPASPQGSSGSSNSIGQSSSSSASTGPAASSAYFHAVESDGSIMDVTTLVRGEVYIDAFSKQKNNDNKKQQLDAFDDEDDDYEYENTYDYDYDSIDADKLATLERSVEVINYSGQKVELAWVTDGEARPDLFSSLMANGTSFEANSFVGHRFRLRILAEKENRGVKKQAIKFFDVEKTQDQVVVIYENFDLVREEYGEEEEDEDDYDYEDDEYDDEYDEEYDDEDDDYEENYKKQDEDPEKHEDKNKDLVEFNWSLKKDGILSVDHCRALAVTAASSHATTSSTDSSSKKIDSAVATSALKHLVDCIHANLTDFFLLREEEQFIQLDLSDEVANAFESAACAVGSDATPPLPSTQPLSTHNWVYYDYEDDKRTVWRPVQVLHDTPSSKIHYIKNFITKEECEIAREEADDIGLEEAVTLNDEDGTTTTSKGRKATQASIEIPWDYDAKYGDPMAELYRRMFAYTNEATGYNLTMEGQEELIAIQYVGRGKDDPEPDQYKPHCDGDCDGEDFRPGKRVATIVAYCDIPETGGATSFKNAGVKIVPEQYGAAFFSYYSPKDKKMDNGYSLHSGCPVLEGKKMIVTAWMRMSVNAEHPWQEWTEFGQLRTGEEKPDEEADGEDDYDDEDFDDYDDEDFSEDYDDEYYDEEYYDED